MMKLTYETEGMTVTVKIERLSPIATAVIEQLSKLLMPTLSAAPGIPILDTRKRPIDPRRIDRAKEGP